MKSRFFDDSTDNDNENVENDIKETNIEVKKDDEQDEDYLFSDVGKNSHIHVEEDSLFKKYTCTECKTSYFCSGDSKKCIYCDGECSVGKDEFDTDEVYYLSFEKSIDDAIKEYKKSIRGNIFLSFAFRKKNLIDNIKKVYFPALLVNCNAKGKIVFYAADNDRTKKKLLKYEVGNTINVEYENIIFPLYSKFNSQNISVINEYDYSSASLFDSGLKDNKDLSFINSDISNGDDVISLEVNKQAVNLVRERIKHDLRKVKSNDIDVKITSKMKILLPAYILNINNKDKNYLFFMNGQNGKSFMERELSKINIIVVSVIIFLLIFISIFLIVSFI